MKYIFKILLIISITNSAKPRSVIIVSYKQKNSYLRSALALLEKKVPKSFIKETQDDQPCSNPNKQTLLHLCFHKEKDFKVIWQNKEVLKRTVSMFEE